MRINGGIIFIGKDDWLEGAPLFLKHCLVVFEGAEDPGDIYRCAQEQLPDGSVVEQCHLQTATYYAAEQASLAIERAKKC